MSTLAKLQTEFRRHILQADEAMRAHVVGTERVDATTRLAIYANAYRLRLLEALDANYPALHAWLGDDEFHRLGHAYIEAHPSRHYSIRWFGHRLPEFIALDARWRDDGFTVELTRFEWAMSEAFDAADAAPVTADDMARLAPQAWPVMRLELHPSLHRLTLRWNVPPVWRALTRDEAPEPPREMDSPMGWLVWRQQLTLFYRSLDVDEAWALDAARDGADFAAICEGLCEWIDPENVATRAAGFLRQWIADELVTRLHTPDTPIR